MSDYTYTWTCKEYTGGIKIWIAYIREFVVTIEYNKNNNYYRGLIQRKNSTLSSIIQNDLKGVIRILKTRIEQELEELQLFKEAFNRMEFPV